MKQLKVIKIECKPGIPDASFYVSWEGNILQKMNANWTVESVYINFLHSLITTLATRLQWALHIISIWEKSSPLFPNSPLTCADWPVDLPSFLHSVKSRHIIYACNQSDVIIPIVATLVRILLFLQVSSLALPRLLCTHLIHPSRDKQIIWAKQLAHRWKHRVRNKPGASHIPV